MTSYNIVGTAAEVVLISLRIGRAGTARLAAVMEVIG